MYITSQIVKVKNLDAKLQGLLLKTTVDDNIGIVSSSNIQHRWRVKLLHLQNETHQMLINAVLNNENGVHPDVWAGVPLTEDQIRAFITRKNVDYDDHDRGYHRGITDLHPYLWHIVKHYSHSLTPALKETILSLFATPPETALPEEGTLKASDTEVYGLDPHEFELLLKLFSPQELKQRFPNVGSHIWKTNTDIRHIIQSRKYEITLQSQTPPREIYKIKPGHIWYADVVYESYEDVNITDLEINDVIMSTTETLNPEEGLKSFDAAYQCEEIEERKKIHKYPFRIIGLKF